MVELLNDEEANASQKKGLSLDRFWQLSNAKNMKSRVEAASKLVKQTSLSPSEASYTLKRLIKGLASPSEGTRQSYFVCLVEFLRQTGTSFNEVSTLAEEILKASSCSKSEEGLYFLGLILANMAVLRAGIVTDVTDREKLLENLLDVGSKRSYLHLITFNAVVDYYLADGSVIDCEQVLQKVSEVFKLDIANATIDSLYFILSVSKFNISTESSVKYFGVKEIGKKDSLESFFKILSNTTLPLRNLMNHPALKCLAPVLVTKKSARKLFGLLLPTMNTTYRGQIGIAVLKECLAFDSTACIKDLLTVDCLAVLKDICLKGVAPPVVEVMDIIEAAVKEGRVDCWTMLSRLLECTVCWDKYVPGNTFSFLISKADEDTIVKLTEQLISRFKSDAPTSDRVYAGGLLAKIAGSPQMATNIDWRLSILNALMELTLIQDPNSEIPELSKDAQYQLRDVFYRALDSSCKTLPDMVRLAHSQFTHSQQLLEQRSGVPVKPLTDESLKAFRKVTTTVAQLSKTWKEGNKKESGVFLLLFSHIGLQIFSQPEMALDVLSELQPVYANWKKAKLSKDDPTGIEVVVEIMLSLLAQNKHILRNVVNCTFKIICNQLNDPALQSILAVLEDSSSEDENATADDEDEGDDSDGDDSVDENDQDQEEEESEDDEPEESEDDDQEDTEASKDIAEKIKNALGDHVEKSDVDESDVDMDDIPDEEMKKLDEKLVEAFKMLGGNKSSAEKKKEKLNQLAQQHFKLRVLELLEIYVSHKPAVQHLFTIIVALVERFKTLYSSSKEATLCAKIKQILKKCSTVKLEGDERFDSSPVLEYLLGEGIGASPAIFNLAAVHAKLCLTALRIALPDGSDQAEKLYLDALQQFFDNHQCTLVPEVFQAALGIPWKGAVALATVVSKQVFNEKVRHFRRTQGLAILGCFMRNNQLEEVMPGEKTRVMRDTLDQLLGLINNTDLKRTPLKLLNEVFSILRGLKQQTLLTETQEEQVRSSLKQCASSPAIVKLNNAAKKNLKKVLSFYNLKVQLAQREPKNSTVKKQDSTAATENGGEDVSQKKKKKKKKKSKEAQQEKKEKKIEASAAQEESGLPSFKKLLVDTTQVYMNEEKKKKNKKRKVSESDPSEKMERKKSKKDKK